jgi:putative ABC transport system permease protein
VNGEQGVVGVAPVLSQFVILELHGRKQPAYLVGYEPSLGGGPARMAVGSEPRSDDELVFDRVLAARHGLRIGDSVDLTGREFAIVGLSEGTTSWMLSFVFIRKSAAEGLLRSPGASSFLFVTADGVAAEDLRERLARVPGTEALMKEEMRANDLRLWGKIFSAPLRLMTGIAFLVGTLVVGLVIYTATVERQAEYGVLKAIGAPNRALYRVVVAQALLAAASGAAAGVALAFAVAELIMALRPQFLLAVEPVAIVQALAAGLGMALLAALFPARLMARLAPADVFRR